ncbi:MAG: hypothetical protein NC342_03530 [Pseudoflavonifractor sp.]|nr:capsular biosynthesis protein [Alloprevotella sp.]MCM1116587.1 hypothetical protein [Pseudoflavonifractor sp.]
MSFFSDIFKGAVAPELTGFTDWHSHILPGVDDGVASMDESLAILSRYEEAGIKKVWLTPHIMEDIPNETAALRRRFSELKEAYHGPVELALAAENMMDLLFIQRLEARDLLPIGDNMLLVETSYFNPPSGLEDILQKIIDAGFTPLIAHPERYFYVSDMARYRQWKSMGALLQLNIISLDGYYGPEVKAKAEALLADGMYDRAGSDLHAHRHLDCLCSMKIKKKLLQKLHPLLHPSF